jgi:hypothetical protein
MYENTEAITFNALSLADLVSILSGYNKADSIVSITVFKKQS